jgi:hypothetical protein
VSTKDYVNLRGAWADHGIRLAFEAITFVEEFRKLRENSQELKKALAMG